jgi:hypothetical protein
LFIFDDNFNGEKEMSKNQFINQMDIAAEAFDNLAKAIDHAPYNFEVEEALNELRTELIELGLDIGR